MKLSRKIHRLGILSLVASLCTPWAAMAGTYGEWESSKVGGGGYMQNVYFAPSDPNRMYAYEDVGGAFRSDDRGQHWRLITATLPHTQNPNINKARALDIDPRNADVLLYAAGGRWADFLGVYRSTDGGASWSKAIPDVLAFYANEDHRAAGSVIARDPNNMDTILVGTGGDGIWRSTDNGVTFTKVASTGAQDSDDVNKTNVVDLKFDPSVPGRVWLSAQEYRPYSWDLAVGGYGGFWKSDDYGVSWTRVMPQSTTVTTPNEVVFLNNTIYGLFGFGSIKSSVDGVNWTNYAQGLTLQDSYDGNHTRNLWAITTAGDKLIIALTSGQFYTRTPGVDAQWKLVNRVSVNKQTLENGTWWGTIPGDGGWIYYGKEVSSVTVDPQDVNHWWFTDWYGMWESTDAGANWRIRVDGIESTVVHVIAQNPADQSKPLLGMADIGHFYSNDGGVSWKRNDASKFNNAKSYAISPVAPTKVFATGTNSGTWGADSVYLSNDSGFSWTSINTGLPQGAFFHTVVVDPTKSGVAYVAVSNSNADGVYKTTNSGATWAPFNTGFADADVYFDDNIFEARNEIAASSDGSLVAISRSQSWDQVTKIKRYDPVAATWLDVVVPDWLASTPYDVKADPHHPGRYFLAAKWGVFRSDDQGATWVRKAKESFSVAIDMVQQDRIAAGSFDGVILSLDGGETWSDLDSANMPAKVKTVVGFSGNRVLAGTSGNGVFWASLDGSSGASSSASSISSSSVSSSVTPVSSSMSSLDTSSMSSSALSSVSASMDSSSSLNASSSSSNAVSSSSSSKPKKGGGSMGLIQLLLLGGLACLCFSRKKNLSL